MVLSKAWLGLLSLALIVVLGIALVVPKPASRQVAKAYAEKLDRGQHNADLLLRLEARELIDAGSRMAWDDKLIDLLEQASNRRWDLEQQRAKLAERLLTLSTQLAAPQRPQLAIAVDVQGKQVARIGPGENKLKPGQDGLVGYPLVELALRGYRGDDTWNIDGKLYFVAASPVIVRSRGRYVGALILGQQVNEDFVRRLHERLGGMELAFFLRGKPVATTLRSSDDLNKLPVHFAQRKEQILKDGRIIAMGVKLNGTMFNVVLAPLPGEAGAHDAFYATLDAPPPTYALGGILSQARSGDLSWSGFPWPLLVGGLLLLLVVGIGLQIYEVDRPSRQLLDGLQQVLKNESTKLPERLVGRYSTIGRQVNELLDRSKRSRGAEAAKPSAVAGEPVVSRRGEPLDLPEIGTMDQLPVGQEAYGAGIGLGTNDPVLPSQSWPDAGGGGLELDAPRRQKSEVQSLPLSAPASPLKSGADASFDMEPVFSPIEEVTGSVSSQRKVQIPASEEEALPSAVSALPPLEKIGSAELFPPLSGSIASELPEDSDEAYITSLPGPPPTGAPLEEEAKEQAAEEKDGAGDDEAGFRLVFKDFLAIKRQCGENTSNLTFERFADKLRGNRDSLIQRYGCKEVKFQVYIKDGKAALKATPIKE